MFWQVKENCLVGWKVILVDFQQCILVTRLNAPLMATSLVKVS